MQDIYLYTPDFELLHIESKVSSMQWHLKYADVGTMELHTDTRRDIASKILPSSNKDIIVVQGDNSAWINGLTDLNDDFDIGVFGRTLNHMLNWRVVEPFIVTDTIENIIRNKVTEKFMTSGPNKIDNFVLGNVIGDTNTVTFETDKQITLFDLVQGLCNMDNLGFKIDFDVDNEKFMFNLYRGLNKTSEQTERNALIFSQDEKNISDLKYTFMQQDYYSVGYAKEEIEDVITYKEIIKDDVTGFKRREKAFDKSQEETLIELNNAKRTEQIEGEVRNIKYGIDYNLGDIVTIQKKIGDTLIVQDKRIIEVVQVHEPFNSYEKPILDDEVI